MKMPFGKHRGRPLHEVPESYLCWVLDTCDDISETLRRAIERVLGIDEPATCTALTTDVVGRWHRQLAFEFHPDQRGSHLAMVAINRGHELLLEMVRS